MSNLSILIKKAQRQPGYWLRRDLSGIFVPDSLRHDNGVTKPTCIEDCTQATRLRFLRSLSYADAKDCATRLCKALQRVLDHMSPEEKGGVETAHPIDIAGMQSPETCVSALDEYARLLHQFAWAAGVCQKDSEAAKFFQSKNTK